MSDLSLRGPASLALAALALAASSPAFAQSAPPPPPAAAPTVVVVPAQPAQPDTYVIVQPQVMAPQPGTPPPGYYLPPPGYGAAPHYVAGTGPKYMEYEDGDPIPPGYHKKTRIRVGLVAGGASMFGVSYLLTILTAGIGQLVSNGRSSIDGVSDNKDYGPLLIPVVGPFVGIGTTHASAGGAFGLTFLGLTQAGGVAMFIVGLAAPTTRLVRNDIAKRFTIAPSVAPGSYGLGMTGSF